MGVKSAIEIRLFANGHNIKIHLVYWAAKKFSELLRNLADVF